MRDGWAETTLGEVADVNMGQSPPGETYNTDGIGMPFMQGSAEFGEHYPEPVKFCSAPAKIAEIGDLLLSVRAPVGDSNFANQRIAIGRGLATVRAKRGADTNFLRLVVQLNTAGLLATSGTGMFSSITGKNLREFGVNLPPLVEQKRIVDVVASVDAFVDALQQQADSARTARNAVLHELLSAGGDDWSETTLGLLVSLRTGKLDVNAGVEDGEFPFFTCSRDTYKIDVAAYSGKSVIVAGNGDLNVKYYEGEFNAYQRTYILQAIDESVLNPTFLFHFMDKYLETLRNDTQGSTIQYLKKAQFTEAPISLPPLDEQKRIVEIMSSMDEVIQATEQAVTDAKNLRSGLLSDLLSGEHEIPESYDVFVGAA